MKQIRQSDPVTNRHSGEGLSIEPQIVAASHQLSTDRRAIRLRFAPRRFLCREVQTDAEDVRVRRRTVESSRDGETEEEGEEAETGGHDEEFVFARETGEELSAFYLELLLPQF